MRKIFSVLVFIFILGCTNEDGARRVLQSEGCYNVRITGFKLFGCDKNDIFSTGFECVKRGHKISGVVCEGFLKGKTIRYD